MVHFLQLLFFFLPSCFYSLLCYIEDLVYVIRDGIYSGHNFTIGIEIFQVAEFETFVDGTLSRRRKGVILVTRLAPAQGIKVEIGTKTEDRKAYDNNE